MTLSLGIPKRSIQIIALNNVPVYVDVAESMTPMEFVNVFGKSDASLSKIAAFNNRVCLRCIDEDGKSHFAFSDDSLDDELSTQKEICLPEKVIVAQAISEELKGQWFLIVPKDGYMQEPMLNHGVTTVKEDDRERYGVMNDKGEMVVKLGTYSWISDFDYGLARVRIGTPYRSQFPSRIENGTIVIIPKKDKSLNRWGIINWKGEVVLPIVYSDIWKFEGKAHDTVVVEDEDGRREQILLRSLNPELESVWHGIPTPISRRPRIPAPYDSDYHRTYNEYAGSYAQDVMGLDDDTIGDAFEGDPDAAWNID